MAQQKKQINMKLDDAADLRKHINEIMLAYGLDVDRDMQTAIADVSKEAVKKLKSFVPPPGHNWREYSKTWTFDKKILKKGDSKTQIYNSKHGPLTHLLENGHEVISHGVATGKRTKKYPHIAPVDAWVAQELPQRIEKALDQTL